MAVEPKEFTEDCSSALEKLITVLWIPAGIPTWKIRIRYTLRMASFEK